MPVPYDGQPLTNNSSDHSDHSDGLDGSDTEWDDDDELQPEFHVLYDLQFAVPATGVKVIIFELFGTIFVSIESQIYFEVIWRRCLMHMCRIL